MSATNELIRDHEPLIPKTYTKDDVREAYLDGIRVGLAVAGRKSSAPDFSRSDRPLPRLRK
jgi:hypothetical protein